MNPIRSKPRILIVDDAPENLHLLMDALQAAFQLIAAKTGEKALELAVTQQPDLILLDILMPGIDGYGVCRKLKSVPACRDIPVIFLTARTQTDDIVKGFEAGGVDYVTKPFNVTELLARVRTHLELKNARLRLEREIEERRKAEDEKARIINELEATLAKVQTLSGLLPICAHCKKIRDDKGYWNQIENYIRDHSMAEFSHSICPACTRELYADFLPVQRH